MKLLRNLGIFATCMLIFPVLTSCNNDEPGGSSEEGNNTSNSKNAVIDFDGKVLTKVADCYIEYDEKGRVSEISNDYEYCRLNYSKGVINLDDDKGTFKLNSKGYISEISYSWDDKDEDYREYGSSKYTFNYNDSGYLTSINTKDKETEIDYEDGETYIWESTGTIKLTWNKGNLENVELKVIGDDDGESYTYIINSTISYGSTDNTFQQIPYSISYYSIFDYSSYFATLASTGLFGKGPKKLPTSLEIYEEDEDYSSHNNYEFYFELNSIEAIVQEYLNDYKIPYKYSNLDSSKISSKDKKKSSLRDVLKIKGSKRNKRK